MKNSLIIIQPGDYANSDAYDAVLTYVTKKDYVGGYAIPLPPTKDSLISAFRSAEENSDYQNSRYLWHFVISVPEKVNYKLYLQMADEIAMRFAYQYQVVYALDLQTSHPHIHFAVNAYSYDPNQSPLSEDYFNQYMQMALIILQNTFPMYKAKLTIREEN